LISGNDERRTIRKIAVAFDPACAGPALLDAATALAISFGAELEALLVDDPDMARLTQLPFGRIFEPLSGRSVPLDREAVRSRRAGPMARTRAALRTMTEMQSLNCSVREMPGLALIDAVAASNAELFVIASVHGKYGSDRVIDADALQTAVQSSGSVLLASQLPVKTHRILVIGDDGPLGARATDLARQIAQSDPIGAAALIGHLSPDGRKMDAVMKNLQSLAPTLVVIGLSDESIVAGVHGHLEHDAFSVLTVR
jgi:hypothetical protein